MDMAATAPDEPAGCGHLLVEQLLVLLWLGALLCNGRRWEGLTLLHGLWEMVEEACEDSENVKLQRSQAESLRHATWITCWTDNGEQRNSENKRGTHSRYRQRYDPPSLVRTRALA